MILGCEHPWTMPSLTGSNNCAAASQICCQIEELKHLQAENQTTLIIIFTRNGNEIVNEVADRTQLTPLLRVPNCGWSKYFQRDSADLDKTNLGANVRLQGVEQESKQDN